MFRNRGKKQGGQVKKVSSISWKRVVPGVALLVAGFCIGSIYVSDNKMIVAGMAAAIFLAAGGFLVYHGLKAGASGYAFQTAAGKSSFKGDENAIFVFASRNDETNKDVPLIIKFLKINHPPKGARLHYVRCLKKHYYEFFNETTKRKYLPVVLKDKKSFPPDLFKIPAVMQPYKDALEYIPPTLLQKVAPGIMILAIGIVGILMVMTGG